MYEHTTYDAYGQARPIAGAYAPRASASASATCGRCATLDLDVPPGTVLGLLGHNGAGKTTAVRILTTLAAADHRAARASPASTSSSDAARVRARIGLAGQAATVDGLLTARANLELVGRLYHLPPRRGPAARRRAARAARPRRATPTGWSRRSPAACAAGSTSPRALVAAPPVLFLDEPTTGLDPHSRNDLWDAAARAGRATAPRSLLTTQYLEEADRLADDIVVLDHGRVAAAGSPAELKARDRRRADRRHRRAAERPARRRGARSRRSPTGPASSDREPRRHRAGRARHAADRGRARARRRRRRRHRRPPPRGDARRRLPDPDRDPPRAARGGRMTTTLARRPRPARALAGLRQPRRSPGATSSTSARSPRSCST